ncbi:sulfotransferase [Massilia sp. W12]|uniref:sulfotransferase family protein n=1 Tax=Massilia sp. W12 TaxID=3126507 RepID=UPI0030CDC70A
MDTTPSSHYHTEAVKNFNQDARSKGWIPHQFQLDALMQKARNETGLQKFEDESFIPTLEKLIYSLNKSAELNPFGEMVVLSSIIEPLKTRLRADDCFKKHPEILDYPIQNPICIIGPHRSGTTRMHRMMATDQRLQFLATWEGMSPAPYLDSPDLGRAQRYQEITQALGGMLPCYGEAFIAHPMHPDWPEEEMLLLNTSFLSFSFLGNSYIPEFYQYFLHAEKDHAYAYMVKLMKLISWQRKDPPSKRWLLKNPQHMLDLCTVNKFLPDIKMIFPHRDPLKTVGSVISLMWLFCRQNTDAPRRWQMKEVWWDYCQQSARRAIEARENLPANQQLDVYYQDINHNWKDVMHRVYEFIDLPFDGKTEAGLQAWLHESEKEAHHVGHSYTLEEFGLSTAEVESAMQFVRTRYNTAYEAKKNP